MTIAGMPGGNGKIDGGGGLVVTVHATGAGTLYIKNLLISGGGGTGLRVDGGATINLDHVRVNDNPGGGITISSSGFDIKNTTVSNNASSGGEGLRLQTIPASGKPRSLTNVSVTSNTGTGIFCVAGTDTPAPASGILLTGNASAFANCTFSTGATCTTPSSTCGAQ
jgi:hypothetical protein